ncbi:MAG TPA: ABC transporter permease [Blastocatellia bacterium]
MGIWQDIRCGLRNLAARPALTAVAVFTLALGIGADTAVFSVINGVLLRPIPFKDSDRLVMFWNRSPGLNISQDWLSPGEYFNIKAQTGVFEDSAIAFVNTFNLTGLNQTADSKPERIGGATVSSSLFSVLGVNPAVGRALLPEEDRPGAARVVIISDALWRRRYGADSGVIGKSLTIDGRDYTVAGILPRNCDLNNETLPAYHPVDRLDILMPLPMPATAERDLDHEDYTVLARLRPGVTLAQAQAEVDGIVAALRQDHPDHYPPNSGFTISVTPMLEHAVGDARKALLMLLAAVSLVLLIACANVAGLLLSVGAARRQEAAVRTALGATRARLIRQFLTENILLSLPGGVLGLLLALWGVGLLKAINPGNIPRIGEINVDFRALAFTFAAILFTGLVFGLIPALTSSKVDVNDALKESGRGSQGGAGAARTRGFVVAIEVALCVVVLTAAGLLIRSFARVQAVNPGFSAARVMSMGLTLAGPKYADASNRSAFYNQLWQRLEGIPGVVSVGGVSQLPLNADLAWTPVWVDGYSPRPGETLIQSDLHIAAADYFRAMGIPLVAGRYFDEHDTKDGQRVAIVDEAFAEQLLRGQDPLGRRLKLGTQASDSPWLTIVGVVKSVKHYGLDAGPRITCYFAHSQYVSSGMYVVVRTASTPSASLAAAIRSEIGGLDPDVPIYDVATMDQRLEKSLAKRRFSMLMLLGFGVAAVMLAAVGIYGVVSCSVAERTNEIGIRAALGASGRDIIKHVLMQGAVLILGGIGVGFLVAVIVTRLMSGLLYGVSASDPITFIAVPVILFAVGLTAEIVPARRAASVDPMAALRRQ